MGLIPSLFSSHYEILLSHKKRQSSLQNYLHNDQESRKWIQNSIEKQFESILS